MATQTDNRVEYRTRAYDYYSPCGVERAWPRLRLRTYPKESNRIVESLNTSKWARNVARRFMLLLDGGILQESSPRCSGAPRVSICMRKIFHMRN
jgi:hypothetical protein